MASKFGGVAVEEEVPTGSKFGGVLVEETTTETPKEESKASVSLSSIYEGAKKLTALPEAMAKGIGRKVGISMEPETPTEVPFLERAEQAGIETGVGAGVGYSIPKVLKFIPIPAAQKLSAAMELTPGLNRALGGAAAAFGSSVVRQYAESEGAPKGVIMPLEFLSASLGDLAGSKLTQSLTSLYGAGKAAIRGDVMRTISKVGGAIGSSEEQRAAQAAFKQKETFGAPSPEIVTKPTTKFQEDTQNQLKQQFGFGGKKPVYEPTTGKELMPPATDLNVPTKGVKPSALEPVGETIGKKLRIDPATGKEIPVSQALREDFYKSTTDTVLKMRPEQRFSASPEFQQFENKVATLLEAGRISRGDYNLLMKPLKSDQGSIAAQKMYAETFDETIRTWQGKLGADGKSAVPANLQNNIRADLRDAFSGWAGKNNLGNPEKAYRSAYTAEMSAKAKDEIPYVISKFGTVGDANKIFNQLSKDPLLKPVLDESIKRHLGNVSVEKLPSEIERMEKLLVKGGLATQEQMSVFKKQVDAIDKLRKEGGNALPLIQRLKIQMIRAGTIYVGTGGAEGAYKGTEE